MIVLSHPTGNAFLRAVLTGLAESNALYEFHTTLAFDHANALINMAPNGLRDEFFRRHFDVESKKIVSHPNLELLRLLSPRLGLDFLVKHEVGFASTDNVYQDLDRRVAKRVLGLNATGKKPTGVYCYEDAALHTFEAAKQLGAKCFYDLPIAYWQTVQKLLTEEAARLPRWEATLGGTRDSSEKLARKTEEALLSDVIICPSKFVLDSLPANLREQKKCVVAEFGTPDVQSGPRLERAKDMPLRVLFAGSMSQRKGLADLFQAMKLLNRSDIELVVMGSPVVDLDFYRNEFSRFTYEKPRPHQEVLRLMQSCDVFVLPSIVEGRALVQQEAMLCGLPLIVTANAGGEDLIEEGKTGFLVPMRSPESIAEKINKLADNRDQLEAMRGPARQKAQAITWDRYRQIVLSTILPIAAEVQK